MGGVGLRRDRRPSDASLRPRLLRVGAFVGRRPPRSVGYRSGEKDLEIAKEINVLLPALSAILSSKFAETFQALGLSRELGDVVISQRPDLGQFQCNGALAAAKGLKRNPMEIAREIVDRVRDPQTFKEITIANPGFINVNLSDSFLAEYAESLSRDGRLGCLPVTHPQKVILDFGGPNIAKPMHVGHLRSAIIGDSLQRLLRFLGEQVTGDIHLGDWGTQMGMLIDELKRRRPELPYFDAATAGEYPAEPPVAIAELEELYQAAYARAKSSEEEMASALRATVELQQGRPGYRALWKHFVNVSVEALKKDLGDLGVTFDLWFGESRYQDRIPKMLEELKAQGHAQWSEGALVVHLDQEPGKKKIPPLILVKSDGGYLYGTTDLATIDERIKDFGAQRLLYVVDKRQSLHFAQVFQAAKATGIAENARLEHVAFGTMNGPDGKPFKTRTGGAMKLKDLIEMVTAEAHQKMSEAGVAEGYEAAEREDIAKKVGIAALKFADLMNDRTTDYLFDLEKFTRFEGRTGPYHLYAAIRIKSILRKAEEKGLAPGTLLPPTDDERELVLKLCQFPEAVRGACANLAPNVLCEFAYDLAQDFSRFYERCHILREEDARLQASWLALSRLCLREIEQILFLLGIPIPERM
ncbi:MAG: arginine--tRNA ligase [Elusimicrobia bacterium]|nr:arginine--tRNA ligase [Elusimicrobiota bacterium]